MRVRKRIERLLAVAAALDELRRLEHAKLVRDRGLVHIQRLRNVAHAHLATLQQRQDLDAREVAEKLEQIRQIVERLVVGQDVQRCRDRLRVDADAVAAVDFSHVHSWYLQMNV